MHSATVVRVSKKLIQVRALQPDKEETIAPGMTVLRAASTNSLPTGLDLPVTQERAPHAELAKEPIHHPPLPQGQQTFLLLALPFYFDDPGCF